MSSKSQLPYELVPIFSKPQNAAAGSLLTDWDFMAFGQYSFMASIPVCHLPLFNV